MKQKIWQIQNIQKKLDVIDVLLENRGLKTKKQKQEFFKPVQPAKLSLQDLGISKLEMSKAVKRIKKAKKNKEFVIIYGDYDADGITAIAILWEALYGEGIDVLPYVPDRFSEGYGINSKVVELLKKSKDKELKLVITVDNGIVANGDIERINKLGIDVIVTDHHQKGRTKPKALAVVHTTKISGSGLAWILAREVSKSLKGLELAAIGTIADQMALTDANRSFAKYGLEELNKTKRLGLKELIEQAGLKMGNLGTYEINYMVAPRINSMGRLKHGLDSLRLLCAKNKEKARVLARLVSETNLERQKIVDEVIGRVRARVEEFSSGIIFLSHESYHEGVIGLAAGKLVEEFWRPAIVVCRGEKISKGSARSIPGFNIIETIGKYEGMLVSGGGHPMAAGFTIETTKLEEFYEKLNEAAKPLLTDEVLSRKLKIDCEIKFDLIDWELVKKIKQFEPNGIGNPEPTFLSKEVDVVGTRLLGKDQKHLKLKLKQGKKFFDAIGFGMGSTYAKLKPGSKVDVVYALEENVWNGTKSLQLRMRDLSWN